jgi:hypothetical protein
MFLSHRSGFVWPWQVKLLQMCDNVLASLNILELGISVFTGKSDLFGDEFLTLLKISRKMKTLEVLSSIHQWRVEVSPRNDNELRSRSVTRFCGFPFIHLFSCWSRQGEARPLLSMWRIVLESSSALKQIPGA